MYNEPKYDEDNVNLGYLKKVLDEAEENTNNKVEEEINELPKRYTSTPQPPYKVGDTWIKNNKIYTCINSRSIGVFNESDWVTESGATEIAETKNRIYISIPKNYHVGDIWILQSDTDHKAGKKGEILNAIQNSEEYNESHWVKDIKYGLKSDINQIAEDLDEAITKINSDIKIVEGKITTAYYQETIPDGIEGDLWYVTETVESYQKGKIYRYDGANWYLLDDPDVEKALQNANTAQITADKKIQSFYSSTEPTENIGVGDLWTDLDDKNKLYRYNGTNWVPIYDTRIEELEETTTKTSETVAEMQTDLGKITARVSTVETTTTEANEKIAQLGIVDDEIKASVTKTETRLSNDFLTAEQVQALNDVNTADIELLKQQQTSASMTAEGLQLQINKIENDGVSKVKNTTVDITEEGVSIGKSDSEFSSTWNNTGTYFKSYGKNIAEYSKDGAIMEKATVRTQFRMLRLKFVERTINGEPRVQGFWKKGE